MENIADLMNKISISSFDVGSVHWVDVTFINNPHSFYVRPIAYRMYLPMLHSYQDHLQPTEVKLGSKVIYKSKLLQCYVRGRVLCIENENDEISCNLFACDYGCVEYSIPLEKLRKPFHSIDIPPLAVHCQLADCKPLADTWCEKVVASMKFFIGREKAKMVIRGRAPDGLVVELYNSCPDDIATMLAFDGFTTLGYAHNAISRFTTIDPEKHYYRFKEYDIDDTLTVRVQTGDSLKSFFVSEVDDYKIYLNERDNFTYFCTKQKELELEDLKIGMPVGVLMITLNKYERGLVMSVSEADERAQVMLVDWGKYISVPFSRLKAMSEKFFIQPVTAIHCSTEESQTWDNGLHKFLFPGFQFKITIVKLGEQFESPHIVKITPLDT